MHHDPRDPYPDHPKGTHPKLCYVVGDEFYSCLEKFENFVFCIQFFQVFNANDFPIGFSCQELFTLQQKARVD